MTLNVRHTIKANSDQLNADDIAGTERLIYVEHVQILNDPKQPIAIFYHGCDNVPFKPCLTVRRILVALWGDDASMWIGRAINLYVDPEVSYGNQKNIGGIRVNALSHIDRAKSIKLSVRRGMKKEYTINPIQLESQQ